MPLLSYPSLKVLLLDLSTNYTLIRWCRSNYGCPEKKCNYKTKWSYHFFFPFTQKPCVSFWCFVKSLTTSWVCASQSAKSIRSKREKKQRCWGQWTSGLPWQHRRVCTVVSCSHLSSWRLVPQGRLGFTELLCSEVIPRGKHPVGPRRRGGIFSRFSLPCPQHWSKRQEEGFSPNSENDASSF